MNIQHEIVKMAEMLFAHIYHFYCESCLNKNNTTMATTHDYSKQSLMIVTNLVTPPRNDGGGGDAKTTNPNDPSYVAAMKALGRAVGRQTKRADLLHKKAQHQQKTIEACKTRYKTLEGNERLLQVRETEMRSEISKLEDSLTNLQMKICPNSPEGTAERNWEMQLQLENATRQIREMERTAAEKDDTIRQLREDLTTRDMQKQIVESDLEKGMDRVFELEMEIARLQMSQESDVKCTSMEEETQLRQSGLEHTLQEQARADAEEIEALKSEIARLSESHSRSEKLKRKVTILTEMKKTLESKVRLLESRVADLSVPSPLNPQDF